MKTFIILLITFPFMIFAGTFGTRGGGDLHSEEFFKILDDTLFYLELNKETNTNSIIQKIKGTPFQVRFSEENLFLTPEQPVQAINDPKQKLIIITRTYWNHFNLSKKTKLLLHEVLSVLDYNDHNYLLSQKLYQTVNEIKQSPLIYWKNKLKIRFKPSLSEQYFVSAKGLFAFERPHSEELICHIKSTTTPSEFYLLSNLRFEKHFFIQPDFSLQLNLTKLSFLSQNKTAPFSIDCKNQSNSIGIINPEEARLETLLESLKPIINKISLL